MFEKSSLKKWSHLAFIGIVVIVGCAYAASLGFYVHNSNKKKLIMRASTVAQFIDAKDIAVLSGSNSDLNNPVYMQIKNKLMGLQAVNPDTRFIYLNGEKNGKIFFYADSENPQSPDYSPPGQNYEEASELMRGLFRTKANGFEITRDRWGFWSSAIVPIVDPTDGRVVALLGIDVSASDYIRDIIIYVLSVLLFAALIVVLFITEYRISKNMEMTMGSLRAKDLELAHMGTALSANKSKLYELESKVGKK